jgi:hypothetical protein
MNPMPSQWATTPKNPLSGLGRNKSLIMIGLMVLVVRRKREPRQR